MSKKMANVKIGIFNNKGGVGKTTYLYHIGNSLSKNNYTVLLADCDSQCNLTSYCLKDEDIEQAWEENGNSIYQAIRLVHEGMGDIKEPVLSKPFDYRELYLIPGDLSLSTYEDELGETWNSARGGAEQAVRKQSAIIRYIDSASKKIGANVVLIDLGPNLGPLNRSILGGCDYFITPVSPDLFSIKGTENLGKKLIAWKKEWDLIISSSKVSNVSDKFKIPNGNMKFLGYVVQRHNLRNDGEFGMTKGWERFGSVLEQSIIKNIVDLLKQDNRVVEIDNYNLGSIPNLHSLIPYSLDARKPVFDCTHKDGLRGSHINKAIKSEKFFSAVVDKIISVL